MQGPSLRRLFAGLCLLSLWLTGCAAFHPVEGVPARYLPTELKVGDRTGKRTIDLSLLRQTPPSAHRIDSGDVLAVYVEREVGKSSDPPPVFFPTNNEGPPSFGLPFPVREDGTISLPRIGSINLRGLTIAQAEEKVKQAYLSPKEIIHPDNHRVQISLQRPRHYRVLVIRQDSRSEPMANSGLGTFNLGMVKRGTGKVVSLPAYNNDVLNALTATDGLPGLDAENAVYIIRNRGQRMGGTLDQQWPTDLDPSLLLRQGAQEGGPVVRGQAPTDDPRYWHANPLERSNPNDYSVRGDISSGPLHEPMRLAPADSSIRNAYYEAAPSRVVDQANWTGHSAWQGDSTRALPLPGRSYNADGSSGIVPVAAWDEANRPNRYGNPFAANVTAPVWPLPHETAAETRPSAPRGMQAAVQPQPWSDPAAQSRAIQLANNDAWSVQPAPQGQQTTLSPSPMQYTHQSYGPPPVQAVPQMQPAPIMQTIPQRPMLNQNAPGAMPFVTAPMTPGTSPIPVGPSGATAPQYYDPSAMPGQPAVQGHPFETGHSNANNLGLEGRHVIRIPIRLGPGETADIREEDIILQDGDIVFIESRDTEVFFTGGLLGGGQFTLPRDYDLDILQALSLASSRGNSGSARVVGGVSALNNDVSISPSTVIVLRKLPDGGEVPIKVDLYRARTDLGERIVIQPGDYILLQYTPLEAVAAFIERHLLEGALFGIASQNFSQGN
ncbi:MAG: polysaccharide biosynthesis/export family protein [Planctomycetota bacterium]